MTGAFKGAGLDSPRLFAELLLAHTIGCDRLKLYTDVDRPASPLEREALRPLVLRALKHEPVQYLVGEAWFYTLPLHVDERVLIPRPSSETLIEAVLRHARVTVGADRALIADVCCGSGCLTAALLKHLPGARAVATDVSEGALDVARLNLHRHGLDDRAELLCGDLLEPLRRHPMARELHYLVANPPYIPDSEWDDVPENVRGFEPTIALRGGADGLDLVRPLLVDGPSLLRPGGLLAVEIAASTAEAALAIARSNPMLAEARVDSDLDGLRRAVVAVRSGKG
jgi:release factor glutamine methyltransferase